jgi:hypothetical protein
MYVCVCMHVCMYVFASLRPSGSVKAGSVCMCMYVCMYVYMHTHTYYAAVEFETRCKYVCMCVCVYVCIFKCSDSDI